MKYVLEYPSELPTAPDDFLQPQVLRTVAEHAEAAGFWAVALSEHPAPSVKWRRGGGHNTLDPIAALGFLAAATTRMKLMTNLYVLPFRNPYLSAKALGSLDLISGGRLVAGLGAGYLRSEFAAVGVDFDDRAARFDEALAALRSIWIDPQTPVGGAIGPVWAQRPTQRPHPPIWIGGNSHAALRRVVEYGTGWIPLIAPAEFASVIRTTAIETPGQFGAAVQRLRQLLADAGREPGELEVQVVCPHVDRADLNGGPSLRRAIDTLTELAGHGATTAVVHTDGSSPTAAVDFITAFGRAVVRGTAGPCGSGEAS